MTRLFKVSQNSASKPAGERKNLTIAPKAGTNTKPQEGTWGRLQRDPRHHTHMIKFTWCNPTSEIAGNKACKRGICSRNLSNSHPSPVKASDSVLPRFHHLSANLREIHLDCPIFCAGWIVS